MSRVTLSLSTQPGDLKQFNPEEAMAANAAKQAAIDAEKEKRRLAKLAQEVLERIEAARDAKDEMLDLDSLDLKEVPLEIGTMPVLKRFTVGFNGRLRQLPPQIAGLTSLEVLRASHTRLSTLPTSVGALRALRVLSISNARLEVRRVAHHLPPRLLRTDPPPQALPRTLGHGCVALEEIHVNNNDLKSLPELTKLRQLRVLK